MYNLALFTSLVTLAVAGPTVRQFRRDDTTECSLTGWTTNSNAVNFVPGGGAIQTTSGSSGFNLGWKGDDGTPWSCAFGDDNCNPLALGGQTLSKDDTGLDWDIEWKSDTNPSLEGCTCTYAGNDYEGEMDSDEFTAFVYNEGSNKCTCKFPCIPQ